VRGRITRARRHGHFSILLHFLLSMYYSTNPQKSPTYLQISPNIRKRVYISTKKSYTSAKEPNMSPHEPSISANESHTSAKEPYMFANEPYISTKEPHIFAKEPYISNQEPYISANEPYKSTKVFLFFLFLMQPMSHIYPRKSSCSSCS